ncbi:Uncharacterised protein [Staphylococcus aureus]|nr:Uncharacterised protein [Staphylococcus aureus]
MTIQLACAIATTAPDLLNPEGTTVAPALVNVALARINRVNGFALVKSSINVALIICGKTSSAPHICLTAGFTNSSNPVKQADGFPDNPNKYFPSANATVVTLPGRIATLLNNTSAFTAL